VGHGAQPLIAYRNAWMPLSRDVTAHRYVGIPLSIVPCKQAVSLVFIRRRDGWDTDLSEAVIGKPGPRPWSDELPS